LYPLGSDAVIVAYGDSLTYGTGAPRSDSYPAVLSRLIKINVINAGIPGETTTQGLKRLPSMLEKYNPSLVLLCLGGNDVLKKVPAKTISANLKKMVALIQSHGAQVFLIAVPEARLTLSVPDYYQNIANEFDIPVDTETLPDLLGDRSQKSDSVHLNRSGYRRFAERIAEQLKQYGAL
ncbi:MAG: hypothetical protein KDH94_04720, partial [Coxiellaceae bacterium]|nr:hypothetical protein [Coxiellaceae bacterium]